MDNDQDIEKLFQSSFGDFEVTPPDDLKDQIDRKLKFTDKKSGNKFFLFGSIIAIVALGITYLISESNSVPQKNKHQAHQEIRSAKAQDKGHPNADQSNPNQTKQTLNPKQLSESSNSKLSAQEQKTTAKSTELPTQEKSSEKQNTGREKSNASTKTSSKSMEKTSGKTNTSKKNKKTKKIKNRGINSEKTILLTQDEKENQIRDQQEKTVKNDLSLKVENDKKADEAEKEKQVEQGNDPKNADPENEIKKTQSDSLKTDLTKHDEAKDTTKQETVSKENKPENELKPAVNKKPFLLLSLKTGPSFALNHAKSQTENVEVNERSKFHLQADATYMFGSKFGASSGFNYYQSLETFTKETTTMDSVQTGFTQQFVTFDSLFYIFDTNGTVIDSMIITFVIDTLDVPVYSKTTVTGQLSTAYVTSSFSIPFMFSYTQKFGNKFYLDLMGGGIVSYQKLRFKDPGSPLNSDVMVHNLGFKACIKTQLRYQFSQFGVSLNSNFSYDFGSTQLKNVKRNRSLIDLGVGIHYQF